MAFSLLIVVHGRPDHLQNVIAGLERSSMLPAEVIVVHMNEAPTTIDSPLNIRSFSLRDTNSLPLARARNYAARQARHDQLIFLDVDCIPGPQTCVQLLELLTVGRLVMAKPLYLPQPIQPLDTQLLALLPGLAQPKALRSRLSFGKSDNYAMFWSLGFAVSQTTFQTIGGFNEHFSGYGAEDTDLAYSARQHGIELYFAAAPIYHQYHESYSPPLNHLRDIVSNAQVFYDTWQEWPMTGWLKAFQAADYINWSAETITISRLPSPTEIAAALVR